MKLDQHNLQFLINVISITGITSLAAICYLLKRDNQELMTRRTPLREPDRRDLESPSASSSPAVSAPEPDTQVQKEAAQPETVIDIRQYVAHRAHGWIAPSESQWNRRLDFDGTNGTR